VGVSIEGISRFPRDLPGVPSAPMTFPPTDGPDSIGSQAAPPGTYLAECFWPGVTAAKLAAVATRAAGPSEATCLQLILIPDDEIVLGIFHAPSPDAVTEASRRVGLPSERIVECLAHQAAPHRPSPDGSALAG
jgi:hypothetical protein